MKVRSERGFAATEVEAVCQGKDCEWREKAVYVREGRLVRAAARRHAATKGHRVWVHVERLSASEFIPEED